MAQLTNTRNLKVNDIIVLTYNNNTTKKMVVTRVEEKSYYVNNCRNSYGTLERYFANVGDIIKCEIIKP